MILRGVFTKGTKIEAVLSEQIQVTNQSISLNDREFRRLSSLIVNRFGIKMPKSKASLLQGRLQKRLKALSMKDFHEYIDYLLSPEGNRDEIPHMIDEVSTNKTEFFRESQHFEFLLSRGLMEYLGRNKKKKLTIWSAGCSSGEEPYTIAFMLNEFRSLRENIGYEILATDISSRVLEQANNGIFGMEQALAIPMEMRRKYLMRGKNLYQNKVRVKNYIREKITFQIFNLMSSDYSIVGNQDIIFCRNVLIYFDRHLQHRILSRLCQQLNPGGYLFLGHSESLIGFSLPVTQLKPSIYMRSA